MTIVKICGLRRPEDTKEVNLLKPEMTGFVFYPPSSRFVTKEKAGELKGLLDPSVETVGVFVDEDPRIIADLVDSGIIDAVQLHGSEDDSYIRGLRGMVDVPMIKAFVLTDDAMQDVESCEADMILLDAGKGSGRTFDWSLAESVGRDYILSGGLNPDNVTDAVIRLHPYGVDVSSGVETDGFKDPDKVSEFILKARSAGALRY